MAAGPVEHGRETLAHAPWQRKIAPVEQNGFRFPARRFQHEIGPVSAEGKRRAVNQCWSRAARRLMFSPRTVPL